MAIQRSRRRNWLLAVAGIAIGTSANSWAQSNSTSSVPTTAYMKSGKFEIPFNLDPTGNRPVEVHLFVSQDAGKTWQLSAKQSPLARSFAFDAAQEGTFWFATRTLDAAGAQHPSGPMSPQLRVTIDASNPAVEATADADGNGQLILDYNIQDPSVAQDGVRIEYITDAVRHFLPVTSASQPQQQQGTDGLRGRVVWIPDGAWRHANVRLTVKDRANNETVLMRQVERPRLAQNNVQLASNQNELPRAQLATQQVPSLQGQGYPLATTVSNPTQPGIPSQSLPPPMQPFAQPNLFGTPMIGTPGQAYVPGQLPPTTSNPTSLDPAFPSMLGPQNIPLQTQNSPLAPASTPGSDALNGQPTYQPGSMLQPRKPMHPMEAMRPLTADELTAANSPPPSTSNTAISSKVSVPELSPSSGGTGIPAGEYLRPSRSRMFSLEYEVETVGTRGVDDVELWGTRDEGATWKRWGSDPDKLSPFDIETTEEGVYGFRIVVVAGNGLSSPRPQPNDPADVYVLVDSTAPVTRLTSAKYGEGDQEGSLVIRYACSDTQLSDRPISLSYAESLQGPWTTFASDLPNTGDYVWPANPLLPRQVFLRIEAVDHAGNIGTHTLDAPIAVQGLAPKARIRGFSPIDPNDSGRAASLPRSRR